MTQITRQERHDLMQIVKLRSRVVRESIEAASARVLADVEAQLAAKYSRNDAAWKEITAQAEKLVKEVDAEIAKRCKSMGLSEQFRPGLSLEWYSRGENADKKRREELRRVAESEVEAQKRAAKSQLLAREGEILTEITAGGLTSEAAQELFRTLPTAEQLMPKLQLGNLEKKLPLLRMPSY